MAGAQLHGGTAQAPSLTTTAAKTPPDSGWNSLPVLSMLSTLMLGTYVIVTFDPNIS